MSRTKSVVFSLMCSATALAAQNENPAHNAASAPYFVGLGATILPIATGIAMIAAGNGNMEAGPGAAGFFLTTGGLLLGPAIGNWVGGLKGRGFAWFGLRTAALAGGLIAGFNIAWHDPKNSAGNMVALSGIGVATGLAIWDLSSLRGAVRRKRAKSISLLPTLQPEANALGVLVHFTF